MGDDAPVDRDRWVRWGQQAIVEWPWRFYVLNAERTIACAVQRTNSQGKRQPTAARFVELVTAVSQAVDIATANDSEDYVAFATPTNGWKRGEKSWMSEICGAARGTNAVWSVVQCDRLSQNHGWGRRQDGPFCPPSLEVIGAAMQADPLLALVRLISAIDDFALGVPFDEWRFYDGGFRPCAMFPLIVQRDPLPRKVDGQLMDWPNEGVVKSRNLIAIYPPRGSSVGRCERVREPRPLGGPQPIGWEVETTNCAAIHTPRGSCDTPLKSARLWQASDWHGWIDLVYRRHRDAVLQAWKSHDIDPVFELLRNPTRDTVRTASRFLRAVLHQSAKSALAAELHHSSDSAPIAVASPPPAAPNRPQGDAGTQSAKEGAVDGSAIVPDKPRAALPAPLNNTLLGILKALDGRVLRVEELAGEVTDGETTRLYRDGMKTVLEAEGKIKLDRKIGWYRPDSPPPERLPPAPKLGAKK